MTSRSGRVKTGNQPLTARGARRATGRACRLEAYLLRPSCRQPGRTVRAQASPPRGPTSLTPVASVVQPAAPERYEHHRSSAGQFAPRAPASSRFLRDRDVVLVWVSGRALTRRRRGGRVGRGASYPRFRRRALLSPTCGVAAGRRTLRPHGGSRRWAAVYLQPRGHAIPLQARAEKRAAVVAGRGVPPLLCRGAWRTRCSAGKAQVVAEGSNVPRLVPYPRFPGETQMTKVSGTNLGLCWVRFVPDFRPVLRTLPVGLVATGPSARLRGAGPPPSACLMASTT